MPDEIFDSKQLINGAAILLSFFVGYKYGLKYGGSQSNRSEPSASTSKYKTKEFSSTGEYKMVLVVRNDLKMGKGKIAAQCGHGAVGAYQTAIDSCPQIVRRWEKSGCAKIAVKVESKDELMAIRRSASIKNLNYCVIHDAGRTQVEPNTVTVLAIGPAKCEDIDAVTGHLKLL